MALPSMDPLLSKQNIIADFRTLGRENLTLTYEWLSVYPTTPSVAERAENSAIVDYGSRTWATSPQGPLVIPRDAPSIFCVVFLLTMKGQAGRRSLRTATKHEDSLGYRSKYVSDSELKVLKGGRRP